MMINITFPDGSVRSYEQGVTGFQIAESISPALARSVVSCGVNGETVELNRPINEDAKIELYKFDDEQGKHTFWHTSAHLLAEALQELYPGIQFGFGPAVENGFFYDVLLKDGESIKESDFPKIEAKMKELAGKKEPVVRREVPKAEALKQFAEWGQTYKCEHIEQDLEDGSITTYTQGNFTDLCRGPHLVDTGEIKAVKLTSVAGAFWRGDANREQMQRLYGISFPKKKMLDEYLEMLEEAKKRDHRKIGKEMELFMFSDKVGKGLPIWLPKGTELRLRLQDHLRKVQKRFGYQEVITPHIGSKNLYVTSGHYAHYGKDSFQYRYEQSGELHGLTRVRSFTQDDAHLFCRPDQVKQEFLNVMDIIGIVLTAFGFNFEAQISLRDPNDHDKYVGTDEDWALAEKAIVEACQEKGLPAKVEYGEAAFYGPKLDFMIKDAIGRRWQLGTIQVDYNLPKRFQLEYTDEDNTKKTPVMIHRAPFGSLERFCAVLIEHTSGHFPLWLTPDQVAILPLSEKYNDYAQEVAKKFDMGGVRATIDLRNEKLGRKIRDNELKRIPYMVIVGEKEQQDGTVAVRPQGGGEQSVKTIQEFIDEVNARVAEMTKDF